MKHQTLTDGNITQQLITLTIPLLAGNIIQQFYNTADMMIVSHFAGNKAFAAVGVCTSITNLFVYILVGLGIGFSILYANEYGGGDFKGLRNCLFVTLVLGTAATLLLTAVGLRFDKTILSAIQTPEELMRDSIIYLQILFGGLLFQFFFHFFSALLRAIGRTTATLYVLLVAMGIKIVLDLLFIAILQAGVAGAAWATLISQSAATCFCIGYIHKYLPELRLKKQDLILEKLVVKRAVSFGTVSAVQQSGLFFGKLLIQGAINAMGTAAVQAYTAAICIEQLILAFGDSGAAALTVFVAQNDGSKNEKRVKEGFKQGARLQILTGMVLSVILFFSKDIWILLLLPGESEAVAMAGSYLNIMCICFLFSFAANPLQGYFRGLGKVSIALAATFVQIIIRVAGAYGLPQSMFLNKIALATGAGWGGMIVLQTALLIKQENFKRLVLSKKIPCRKV